ncbi:MAG: ATP-binding protein [Rickettsiales bacterium]|nr:ATP-binding protein [Rickettsiales bacterium]
MYAINGLRATLHKSLFVRSIFAVAFVSLVVLGAAGFFYIRYQANVLYQQKEKTIDTTLSMASRSLALAVWNFDETLALDSLKALEEVSGFCGARILDKNGAVFTEYGWQDAAGALISSAFDDRSVTVDTSKHIEESPILFNDPNGDHDKKSVIGLLQMCDNHTIMQQQIEYQRLTHFVATLMMAVALMAVMATALQLIFKPLSRLGGAMGELKMGLKKITDPKLLASNEVGQLGRQFNQMIEDLINTQRSLEEKIEEAQNEAQKNNLLYDIVSVANEATSSSDHLLAIVIATALERSCRFWGWAFGHCYLLNTEKNALESSRIWAGKQLGKYQAVIDVSETLTFAKGQGMPGKVWETRHSFWIEKLPLEDPTIPCSKTLTDHGIRSIFGFPIMVGDKVYGVIEFGTLERTNQDAQIVNFMEAVGKQIGAAIERWHFQKSLNLAKEQAEKANRSKSLFLSNMSHELRTPMHAILNYSEMGQKQLAKGDREKLEKYLINIHTAGKRLLGLLNNLLDLSKLEAGKMELALACMPLEAAVEYAITELDSLFNKKLLTVDIKKETDHTLTLIDHERMVQVLVNLLSNAIKYSPQGGKITISLATYKNIHEEQLQLSVINQGPPIPEQDLERIFNVFEQSQGSREVGGTGLGLAICREIIHGHNGTIWAENINEYGVAFHILLPINH